MKHLNVAVLFLALTATACEDEHPPTECGSGTTLTDGECVADIICGSGTTNITGACIPNVTCGPDTIAMNGVCVPTVAGTYVQVEHLGRPGINEALLITDGYLQGYNATAPTFAGVPTATLTLVVAEAKTVLRALYLGACFLNGGIPGITAATGVKPAGITCHAIGAALVMGDGETQTAASVTNSSAYADTVFGLFTPDVLRINTTGTSAYQTLCAGGPMALCGGRWLRDDVIDTTYDFLLNGLLTCSIAGIDCVTPNQFTALTSDGVAFRQGDTGGGGSMSRHAFDASNRQQGHPEVSNTFPYSAAPH